MLLVKIAFLLMVMTRKRRIFVSIDFSNDARKNTSRKRKKSREADGDSAARTFLTFISSSFTRERRINSVIES